LGVSQYQVNYFPESRLGGCLALHQPAIKILIFTAEQLPVKRLLVRRKGNETLAGKRFQQKIELQHTSTAVPDYAVFIQGTHKTSSLKTDSRLRFGL
jgi:hypothetical protein